MNKTIKITPRQIKVLAMNQLICHYVNNIKQRLQEKTTPI
jgi:hypothetical protein